MKMISSLKVMLDRNWLTLVLGVNFMTLNILNFEFLSTFLEFIIEGINEFNMENHQFIVILSYLIKLLVSYHLLSYTLLALSSRILT